MSTFDTVRKNHDGLLLQATVINEALLEGRRIADMRYYMAYTNMCMHVGMTREEQFLDALMEQQDKLYHAVVHHNANGSGVFEMPQSFKDFVDNNMIKVFSESLQITKTVLEAKK